jgi:flagellar biosynthesis/type III secretory pathway protein FliH
MQTSMTLAVQDTEAKLNSLTMQTMEEIVNKEAEVTTVVQEVKESLQRVIEAWKSMTQQA